MSVRAYLFDYGGTLDGEGSHWFDRTVELYRRAGSDLPVEEIKRAFYHADAALEREATAARLRLGPMMERHLELQAEVLGEATRRVAPAIVEEFCAITRRGWEAARRCFERLRPHARLGVVSNFYGNLETLLEEGRLAPFLDVVLESVRVGLWKPDPALYRLAAERLLLEPCDVVMVGDNFERDVRAARAVGMRAVWLRAAGRSEPESGVADLVIDRLSELPLPGDPSPWPSPLGRGEGKP